MSGLVDPSAAADTTAASVSFRRGPLRLAGDSWGDADRPLVVLLHGGAQTRHSWTATGTALTGVGYQVVSYDCRGHGDSSWAEDGDYTQDAMVADLEAVVDGCPPPRAPMLVGASMGGATALLAAGEGRVRASALVLVDTAARVEKQGISRLRVLIEAYPAGFASVEDAAAAVARRRPDGRSPRPEALLRSLRRHADGRYRWHWDPWCFAQPVDLDRRQARLERAARNIRVPCLLIRGARSDVVSDEGARQFLELCRQSQYVELDHAGHTPVHASNEAFTHTLVEFLGQLGRIDGRGRQ